MNVTRTFFKQRKNIARTNGSITSNFYIQEKTCNMS